MSDFVERFIKRGIITFLPFFLLLLGAQLKGIPASNPGLYIQITIVAFLGYTFWYWSYAFWVVPRLEKKYGGKW